jgi:predicted site-specific integrase-resolvase
MNIVRNEVPAAEALKRSGVPLSAATLRRYLIAGKIQARRIGGRWYCTPQAIEDALVQVVQPA